MGKLPHECRGVIFHTAAPTLSESTEIRTIPIEYPETDEVLVRVHAAALNPLNYQNIKNSPNLSNTQSFQPHPIGADISGEIVAMGPRTQADNVSFQIGDCVIASAYPVLSRRITLIDDDEDDLDDQKADEEKSDDAAESSRRRRKRWQIRGDGMAEYVVLNIGDIVAKPPTLTHVQAASLPLSGVAVYRSLVVDGVLEEGDRILIFGGSCSTGLLATQIASALEASFIVVTSTQTALCVKMGANQVIDHIEEDVWSLLDEPESFDVILDCVGGREHWEKGRDILKKDGTFVTLVGDVGPFGDDLHDRDESQKDSIDHVVDKFQSLTSTISRKFWHAVGSYGKYEKINCLALDRDLFHESIVAVSEIAGNGFLRPVVDDDRTYRLENIDEAFDKLESHRAHGKLVVELV